MSGEPVYYPTIEQMAAAGGVSAALILLALRNPQVWEVIGGGPGVDPRMLSPEGKAELHAHLGEIHSGLMNKVKDGDLAASALALKVATQRAMLR